MVKRVYGKCDSKDIIFFFNSESGLWETTIPRDADGEYIVEIYAEDEAGNTSFFAKMLFTVSIKGLCLSARIVEIGADYSISDVEALFNLPKYRTSIREYHFDMITKMRTYNAEVVRCELCERW